jgi:O-antigen ligase
MKNKETWSLLIIFLILPFVMLTSGVSWKSQQIFMLMASSIIVAFSLKNIWLRSFVVYLFLWTIYLFIRSLANPTIHFNVAPQTGMSILLFVLAGVIIVKFVSMSKLEDEKFYHVIRIAVVLQIIISVSQYLGFYPWDWLLSFIIATAQTTADVGPFIGTLGNRDILGCFIGISIPMFLSWKEVKPYQNNLIKALIIVVFIVLLFSPSPGTVAALIGVGIYYSNKNWKYALIAIIAALSYLIIYTFNAYYIDVVSAPSQFHNLINSGQIESIPQSDGRLWKWMFAASQIIKSPETVIFGFGPGAFWGRKYPLHNEYIQCWFELGLVGLILMLGYVISTIKFLIKSKDMVLLTAFVIVCIDAGANYPMHIATTAFLVCIIAGLIERKQIQRRIEE